MDDSEIIRLYWDRDDAAISATSEKYGAYCTSIARNILGVAEDAEECVSDTWLRAWNAMPPQRPRVLRAFLGRIARNLSLNRYERERAEKRGGGEAPLVLGELADCVSGQDSVEGEIDRRELVRAIEDFLRSLPPEKRAVFIRRYWYFESAAHIASGTGLTANNVAVTLARLRKKLRAYLLERGFGL